jgi:hypothetical protein
MIRNKNSGWLLIERKGPQFVLFIRIYHHTEAQITCSGGRLPICDIALTEQMKKTRSHHLTRPVQVSHSITCMRHYSRDGHELRGKDNVHHPDPGNLISRARDEQCTHAWKFLCSDARSAEDPR